MSYIHLITGGERSGKSTYAESEALRLSPHPVYLATARIWDEEFRQRILRHQERRGPEWTNIEEDVHLSQHDLLDAEVMPQAAQSGDADELFRLLWWRAEAVT